jgi:hypothetical protein
LADYTATVLVTPANGMTYKWLEGIKHAAGKKAKMRVSAAVLMRLSSMYAAGTICGEFYSDWRETTGLVSPGEDMLFGKASFDNPAALTAKEFENSPLTAAIPESFLPRI